MKKTHDKVSICKSCFYRIDCDDKRNGTNSCLLYKKDPEVGCNENHDAKNEGQYINDQHTIKIKTDYFRLLYKNKN